MDIHQIFGTMVEKNATDAFIKTNSPLRMRIFGSIKVVAEHTFTKRELSDLASGVMTETDRSDLHRTKNCELAITLKDRWRFRIVIFYEKDELAIVIRKIDLNALSFAELNLPEKLLEDLCKERRGLILVTGMTGSGKSTTIASMLEYININFEKHILTMEELIEFTFHEKRSTISQRAVGKDVLTFADALRQSVVQSPDIIYIGTIRDRDTCYAALSAAETGMLVLSTIHSMNSVSTIERMLNFFPIDEHDFLRDQLSSLLKGVVSLRLVPRCDVEGVIPAYETMTASPTISGLIRDNKLWEIPECIEKSEIFHMKTFNQCFWEYIQQGKITLETALKNSDEKKELTLLMNRATLDNE